MNDYRSYVGIRRVSNDGYDFVVVGHHEINDRFQIWDVLIINDPSKVLDVGTFAKFNSNWIANYTDIYDDQFEDILYQTD